MILYVNGCSWSSQSTHEMDTPVYGDFLATKLGATLINHSLPSSCNDRIFRSTVRSLNDLKNKDEVICVLNVSQIYRSEIWLDEQYRGILASQFPSKSLTPFGHRYRERYQQVNDGEYVSFIMNAKSILVKNLPLYDQLEKCSLVFTHYEREYYELFYQLTMLTTYLKQNNIKYLIFAGTTLLDYTQLDRSLPWIDTFYKEIVNDPSILNFDKINFCEWAYNNGYKNYEEEVDPLHPWTGHPDERAHAAWADFLYNKLKEIYEI